MIFGRNIRKTLDFGFHVDLRLSNCIPKISHSCCALSQLLGAPFLVGLALETQIFMNNLRNWWSMDPPASCEISLTVRWLWGLSSWLSNSDSTVSVVDVIISMRTASAAAQTPVDCSELHQQPVDAVLRPTFVHKLCYKLPSVYILADFWLKFCLLYWAASKLPRLLDTVSKFALFSVSDLKDEKLIKSKLT